MKIKTSCIAVVILSCLIQTLGESAECKKDSKNHPDCVNKRTPSSNPAPTQEPSVDLSKISGAPQLKSKNFKK